MKRTDYAIVSVLFVLLLLVWLHNLAWISTAADTVPILIALPLFIWLGSPWNFLEKPKPLKQGGFWLGGFFILTGLVISYTFLMALGWTILLWHWLASRLPEEAHRRIFRLLPLPFAAFPWIALDFERISWWFRLSGASVTAYFFDFFGYNVLQEGTNLVIDGLPIAVDVACAGLNTLQSMMIVGTVANFMLLGRTPRYWWNFLLLIFVAWLANTVRIIGVSMMGLIWGAEFAVGAFHTWGGLFILLFMFGISWALLSFQVPKEKKP